METVFEDDGELIPGGSTAVPLELDTKRWLMISGIFNSGVLLCEGDNELSE
jgi:hypothetical protein